MARHKPNKIAESIQYKIDTRMIEELHGVNFTLFPHPDYKETICSLAEKYVSPRLIVKGGDSEPVRDCKYSQVVSALQSKLHAATKRAEAYEEKHGITREPKSMIQDALIPPSQIEMREAYELERRL